MAHKLLLADDSVTIQRVIELTFADEDIDVTTVGDGQMAIDRLDTDPPDIILADVDMPKRDGYEIAAYVKSRPTLAHIPVVLLTGAFEPVDQARAAAAGSTDVLAKPFEPQMVINRVKELLGRKRSDDRGDAEAPQPVAAEMGSLETRTVSGGSAVAEDDAVSLDDYFDQLDAAFSTLQSGAASGEAPERERVAPAVETLTSIAAMPITMPAAPPAPMAEVLNSEFSVLGSPSPETQNLESGAGNGQPEVENRAPLESFDDQLDFTGFDERHEEAAEDSVFDLSGITAEPSAPSQQEPVLAAVPPVLKPAGNPFATLSAVKAEAAARPPAPAIGDDVIEEIVSRVLRRMSDNVVRDTVASIVSETAERLVQEEINRIKGAQ
jgi:CheY-like chemotaxis protein